MCVHGRVRSERDRGREREGISFCEQEDKHIRRHKQQTSIIIIHREWRERGGKGIAGKKKWVVREIDRREITVLFSQSLTHTIHNTLRNSPSLAGTCMSPVSS